MAFVLALEEAAGVWLWSQGVIAVDQPFMLATVATWDWRKQDAAVHGLLHFLAHVEQKPEAVTRLLQFIGERDPAHDSLAYFPPARKAGPPA